MIKRSALTAVGSSGGCDFTAEIWRGRPRPSWLRPPAPRLTTGSAGSREERCADWTTEPCLLGPTAGSTAVRLRGVPEDRAGLRFAVEDVAIELSRIDWAQDVPGIRAREVYIEGHRWAIVEYAPSAKRHEWCFDGHGGFVIGGAIEYEFEDGGPPLTVGEGDAFALSTGRAHRGTNRANEPTRLFLIDDPADSSR
jgi:hypothetical protein